MGEKSTFCHFRKPTQLDKLAVFDQKGLTQGTDFLDTVDQDELEGSWSLRFDAAAGGAQLRSNVYPGLTAYAAVQPRAEFGYAYFGDGVRNDDLAFMLP